MSTPLPIAGLPNSTVGSRVNELLAKMTLAEKIGQMSQVNASEPHAVDALREDLQSGQIGAVLNIVDVEAVNELQRIAVEESRLGIPLLVGRDVIHGFKTVLPIPLGQAAAWNRDLATEGARVAALEASRSGVNWTFAPMMDITRDPRWGRIAESLGEDPYLAAELAAAMIEGFQGDNLSEKGSIAACAKHFAGYGAVLKGDHHSGRYDQALVFMPDADEAVALAQDTRFFTPAYWGPYGWIGLDLGGEVDWEEVAELDQR